MLRFVIPCRRKWSPMVSGKGAGGIEETAGRRNEELATYTGALTFPWPNRLGPRL